MTKMLRGSLLALLLVAAAAGARAQPIQVGREFIRLDPPRPVSTGTKIEVIEFFYYGCPICYETQPLLARWLITAPDYVALRRVPAVSNEGWEPFAKLFFTLQALGQIGRLHWPIYDKFHFDGLKLNEEPVMIEWVSHNGVERDAFVKTYHSPEIQAKVEEARRMLATYDIRGVPSFVVDGKYLTSARLAGGTREMIRVLDELVRRARQERPD